MDRWLRLFALGSCKCFFYFDKPSILLATLGLCGSPGFQVLAPKADRDVRNPCIECFSRAMRGNYLPVMRVRRGNSGDCFTHGSDLVRFYNNGVDCFFLRGKSNAGRVRDSQVIADHERAEE